MNQNGETLMRLTNVKMELEFLPFERKLLWLKALRKNQLRELFASAGPVWNWRSALLGEMHPELAKPFPGKNSLPFFNSFRKSFFSLSSGEVFGFNVSWLGRKLGYPGYFRVVPLPSGELLFDYTAEFPIVSIEESAGFPTRRFVPNRNFLFSGLQDVVRDLGNGVLIGEAFKVRRNETTPLGIYFALLRKPIDPVEIAADRGKLDGFRILQGQAPLYDYSHQLARAYTKSETWLSLVSAYSEAQHKVLEAEYYDSGKVVAG